MRTLIKFFKYTLYFFQAETAELRKEAYESAKAYYNERPLRSAANPYPTPIQYQARLRDSVAYQRGYINQRCHDEAIRRLSNPEVHTAVKL